nr:helix-turn-helix transcriptional regulator [Kineosporia babensis]
MVSRRARITPKQAGIPTYGRRRVSGLRRSEVAQLTGISEDYYVQLERGDLSGVSEGVLHALAGALRMDEAERSHLFDLARQPAAFPRRPLRPGIQQMVDAIRTPAFVRNSCLDLIAVNNLARILYAPLLANETPPKPANFARFCFLDPQAQDFYPDWETAADATVALMRTEAGRDPHGTHGLVQEIADQSEPFRRRWAQHEVVLHHTGVKDLQHPAVGQFRLAFEALPLPADPGLTLAIYTSTPESRSAQALEALLTLTA